jgi:hypothetical protein
MPRDRAIVHDANLDRVPALSPMVVRLGLYNRLTFGQFQVGALAEESERP